MLFLNFLVIATVKLTTCFHLKARIFFIILTQALCLSLYIVRSMAELQAELIESKFLESKNQAIECHWNTRVWETNAVYSPLVRNNCVSPVF